MRKLFELAGQITVDGLEGLKKHLTGLEGQLSAADKAITKFGRQAEKIGSNLTKTFTAPILAIGAGIGALTLSTAKYADNILDLEQVTGLSTDTLQEFEHVIRQAGGDFEGFLSSINKLTNSMPDIIKGTGPAAAAIKTLGVNVLDSSGHVKKMDLLFPELLDKLRGVPNVTERNALAMDLFGKSLKEIAPILGMTTQAMDASRKEAHDLGLIMGVDALKAADAYGSEMRNLQGRFLAFVRILSAEFIPIIRDTIIPLVQNKIIPAFQSLGEKAKELITWFRNLDESTKNNIVRFTFLLAAIGPVILAIGKFILIGKSLVTTIVLIKTAMTGLTLAMATNPFTAIVAGASLLVLALAGVATAYDKVDKSRKRVLESVVDETAELKLLLAEWKDELTWLEKQKKPSQDMINTMADLKIGIESIQAELGELSDAPPVDIISKEELEKQTKAYIKRLTDEKKYHEIILQAHKDRVENEKLVDETAAEESSVNAIDAATDWVDAYQKQALAESGLFNQKKQHTAEEKQMAIDAVSNQLGLMASIFQGQKKYLGLYKTLSVAQALMDTYASAVAAFKSAVATPIVGSILGPIAAGVAVAAGLANVARITAIKLAQGAFVKKQPGGIPAVVGEGKEDELIMPMETGVASLADRLISKLAMINLPLIPSMSSANANAGESMVNNFNFSGTLVADERGLKELQRRLLPHFFSEMQRTGNLGRL